jgi:hypothetical protein
MRLPALNPARRHARRAERLIQEYEFPHHLRRKLERDSPGVEWALVERGLREWLICCAYRRKHPLGMPSRVVDYSWHAFILDTASYRDFCDRAYGRFLDHFPEDATEGVAISNYETVWAWDRSLAAKQAESVLWDLDRELDIDDPWGISERDLIKARSGGNGGGGGIGGCGGGGGGCATGDAGGSGCGGGSGGCGGGCGGGG